MFVNAQVRALPALYSQQDNPNPIAEVRFFDSIGSWSWYAIEFDGDNVFYGLVRGHETELGYFTLGEFLEVNTAAGFERIRRDPEFRPTPIRDLM